RSFHPNSAVGAVRRGFNLFQTPGTWEFVRDTVGGECQCRNALPVVGRGCQAPKRGSDGSQRQNDEGGWAEKPRSFHVCCNCKPAQLGSSLMIAAQPCKK